MKNKHPWPNEVMDIAIKLHSKLSINNKTWHKSKTSKEIRAAELISAALVQLVSGGSSEYIASLLEQSLKWLRGEIKDPGCPNQ